MIEPRSRGVLDPRLRGDDSVVWDRTIPVIASEAKQSMHLLCRDVDCIAALAMTRIDPTGCNPRLDARRT
jgi:hypothetical protein